MVSSIIQRGTYLLFILWAATFSRIEIKKDNLIKIVKVAGGPLSFADGIELLSPTSLLLRYLFHEIGRYHENDTFACTNFNNN